MPDTKQAEANQSDELVTIFDTEQESEAMVVKGLLESSGLEVLLTYLDAPQDVLPGVGGVKLQVRPDQVEEARALITEYKNTGVSEAEMEEEEPQH